MNERWLLGLLSLILLALIFWPASGVWVAHLLLGAPAPSAIDQTALENQALKAQLAVRSDLERALPAWRPNLIPAAVYSRYPLNFKNELWLNAGEKDGVRAGAVALVPSAATSGRPFVLVGKVSRVWSGGSLVSTVFDPDYQLAVRIGTQGTEALLKGGSDPRLTLLPKNSSVKQGDVVYTAAPGLPYGLAIAEVENVTRIEGQVFGEADLRFAYDINQLHALWLAEQ